MYFNKDKRFYFWSAEQLWVLEKEKRFFFFNFQEINHVAAMYWTQH